MTNIEPAILIEALCSLSLVKTSPPADLLRHFLYIRSNAISSAIKHGNLDTLAILNALRLFERSLRDTEVMFPKRISEALMQLKSKPLFNNPEFKAITGLNLDTNEKWLPEDIQRFIPWVRHDELERARINEAVRAWAVRELVVLNKNIERALGDITNIEVLVGLRKEIMDLLKSNDSQLVQMIIRNENPRQKFRELLKQRLSELLKARIEKLSDLGVIADSLMQKVDETRKGMELQIL